MGNWSDYILKLFQSTLPRRERPFVSFFMNDSVKFQSTLPRRERQYTVCIFSSHRNYFNPHSHEGSDQIDRVVPSCPIKISIHTPTKGATVFKFNLIVAIIISIHTPTKGATIIIKCFYTILFISIHTPTKGATSSIPVDLIPKLISIHTPTKGATVHTMMLRTI